MGLIKDIARENIKVLRKYLRRSEVNSKSGLSEKEIERLRKFPHFKNGTANFFNHEFAFTHAPSFLHSVEEIFEGEIYRFDSKSDQPYILDCGANIGLSVYYFSKYHPNAEIFAFEPDPAIFDVLHYNIRKLSSPQIQLFNKAVWTTDTTLKFYSEGALAGSGMVDFSGQNKQIEVNAVDLKPYLKRRVNFLKLDIEGAENEVIFDIKDLLPNVENLFLEYHGIKGSRQNLGDILNLLTGSGFQYYIKEAADIMGHPFLHDENTVFNQQLNLFCFKRKE